MKNIEIQHPQPIAIPMQRQVSWLTAELDLPLQHHKIAAFRGALVQVAGREYDLLHNHKAGDQNYEYRYPLIQYRAHNGRAMLVGWEAGAEILREVLLKVRAIKLEGKELPLRLHRLQEGSCHLQLSEKVKSYRLQSWLPLNEENYEKWLHLDRYVDRIALLESILVGHLLRFATAMQWRLPDRLELFIQDIPQHRVVRYRDVPLMAFDVVYCANIELPPHLALGKAVSHGFGWQIPYQPRERFTSK
jgi:hypothetical protein